MKKNLQQCGDSDSGFPKCPCDDICHESRVVRDAECQISRRFIRTREKEGESIRRRTSVRMFVLDNRASRNVDSFDFHPSISSSPSPSLFSHVSLGSSRGGASRPEETRLLTRRRKKAEHALVLLLPRKRSMRCDSSRTRSPELRVPRPRRAKT